MSPPRRELALDAGLAALTLALSLGMLASERFGPSEGDVRALDVLGGLLAGLTALPLLGRRRAPLTVFAVVTLATAALYGLRYSLGPPFGAVIAIFTLASQRETGHRQARLRVAALAAVLTALLVAHVVARGGLLSPFILLGVIVLGGGWIAGDLARQRRERLDALEERAARAEAEAERERRVAVAEERTRIARDLHDSAGHAISVILVQAGAARLLADRDPERSRAAIATIEEVARETIGDIDRIVRALREGEPEGLDAPPGLAALAGLAERHRSAGTPVSVATEGTRRPLPPAVDRAAFRILQEALTNAARHGAGGARVALDYGLDASEALEITVENPLANGAPPRPMRSGHGMAGMRERAALLGGTLEAAPQDGRFRLRARLPTRGRA